MKNKQFVEYSDKDKRFKIDQLLYLDVDSHSRAELIDLFGIFSDNPMYKILSRRSTTLYILAGILGLLLLCFATLYVQWYVPPSSKTTGHRLLGSTSRFLATNDTARPIGFTSGDFDDPDTDYYGPLDFPEKTNSTSSSSPATNATGNNTASDTTLGPANTTTSGQTTSTDNATGTNTGANTSTTSQTTTSNNTQNGGTLNNNPLHSNTTNLTGGADDEDDGYTDVDLQNGNAPTSYAFFYFLLVLIGVLTVTLAVLECRKRQIYRHLVVFEETTLKTFHNKVNNRIIISSCHEQMVLVGLHLFSIYAFRFLVHNNGTESESINMSSGSMQNAPVSSLPLQSQLGNENSIYNVIEEEGEKYHNAVIGLNKQLQNTQ